MRVAEALLGQGDRDGAAQAAEIALAQTPEFWWPLFQLADLMGRLGARAEAEAAWQRAKALNGDVSVAFAEQLGYGTTGLRALGLD